MARRLDASAVPRGIDLWVLDDLNPDGAAADTRQNAHGVDLNRKLPLRLEVHRTTRRSLGLVDESGGDPRVERRFAQLSGLPLRRLTRYPGSAVGWQNHRLPAGTAFVVELPPGRVTPPNSARLARAVLTLARDLPSRAGKSRRPPLR